MGALVIDDHSLREYFHGGIEAARRARVMLETYYPLLRAVFPIDGEIETIAAYDAYLHDPAGEWDIVALTDASDGRIIGGIQWQAIRDIGASWVDTLAWIEHVWLAPAARGYRAFRHLLATARKHMHRRHVTTGFMEFNDPEKMTPQEMEQDAAGGLSSQDRLTLWAHMGLSELVYRTADQSRAPVPYAQPAMAGGPPVAMLSLAFFALTQHLTDMHLSVEDYLRIVHRAHATIAGVDPATDPTCVAYTAAVRALGIAEFDFAPLRQRLAFRQ